MRRNLSGDDWRVTHVYPGEWEWIPITRGDSDLENLNPPIAPWYRATVPGDVQTDLIEAGVLQQPWRDLESRAAEWTSQRDWVYWKDFGAPASVRGHRAVLRFEGVDYSCHVFLNGHHLGDHAGTYVPFELDATEALRAGDTNRLIVVVDHAPTEPDQQGQIGWTGKVRLWKPRFAYKWDWCTRLIPLGIWDDVFLETWDRARLAGLWVTASAEYSEDCWTGLLRLRATLDRATDESLRLRVSVAGSDGSTFLWTHELQVVPLETAVSPVTAQLEVPGVELWWPNGAGKQNLYCVTVELVAVDGTVLDTAERGVGFRRVRAVPNEGAPADALPYTLEVNGKRLFAKGWNWAPISQLYGRLHEDRYRHAIRLARDAHCNLLRVWGGGLLERELFYNLCDEAGIMVWQEFPQSSSGVQNEPALDEEYVVYCEKQARQMVPRRSHHPSLVIWCGGNELMDDAHVPCGLDHPVLATLGNVVREVNPEWIYLPASPSGPTFAADPSNKGRMHDVHGHWLYLGDPDHYRFYNDIDPLFHSEFGAEGTANEEALRLFLSQHYLWPPDRTNPAWVHHGAWWLHREKVEALFGRIEELRKYVYASQWIQYEGLRYIAEANRRRKWHTSGCAPWQFNESWPNTSCTNSLGYFGDVRPAYWAMRGAYAPISVSVRYDRVRWEPGETLEAEIWLNVSEPDDFHASCSEDVSLVWRLVRLEGCQEIAAGVLPVPQPTEASAVSLGRVEARLLDKPALYGMIVAVQGLTLPPARASGLDKRYLFTSHPDPCMERLFGLPNGRLDAEALPDNSILVKCSAYSAVPLVFVRADACSDIEWAYLTWGYAPFLLPGEEIRIERDGAHSVVVAAMNAPVSGIMV